MKNFFKASVLLACSAAMMLSQAPAYADNDATAPLYRGLGERAGIAAIIHDFLPLLVADPRISAAFVDADMERLGLMLTEQFCELSGGPCHYSGKNMSDTHSEMKISNAQFNALAEDLQTAMDKHDITSANQNKLLAKLAPMQRVIVSK
ncbi:MULTISPECIES: group 1 truncated hemoglobin [unclassified Undibacterium]|uniref:group I truncated hemoglobin n=1 Tax=unclassified Undibacterium TaxID=2630295 RepID=UPI002AC997FD|nr:MULTISPECIES: group 1 truncated hemoglobin [unclassified Undibacterium]MEB0140717.1 group 1 truncated hemoglobin [Undibacterium sp. CCC2.1]MEB0173748.1 group 1 truncated hemoglobin [Undibacterium sp. CCC1.1]MEB0178060.1 group 1 truncated hemoglobin [Undibacterium sp. CCC3.4]MEB0216902.1 group 1 truncated hemoglobin [Undibacterium sp. 5I2]WPX41969.1 group 1 truncated hemoglobin [Undibacterium sp. CCC3.4]